MDFNENGSDYEAYKKYREVVNKHISEAMKGVTPWNKGIPCSEETKKKISEIKKGQQSPNKGVVLSEETKRKMSEAHKGKTTWNKGISCSEETKQKMSETKKKKIGVKLKCVELNMVFDCGKDAAKYLGKNPRSGAWIISQARKEELCYGYHWEIIE